MREQPGYRMAKMNNIKIFRGAGKKKTYGKRRKSNWFF